MTSFTQSVLLLLTTHCSDVLTVLLNCYEAGATWNRCCLGACSVYTIQSCTGLQHHFVQSHICWVHLCLALLAEGPGSFTCYCSNTGEGWIQKQESAQKADPGEEHFPATPAGNRTCSLFRMSPALSLPSLPVLYRLPICFPGTRCSQPSALVPRSHPSHRCHMSLPSTSTCRTLSAPVRLSVVGSLVLSWFDAKASMFCLDWKHFESS